MITGAAQVEIIAANCCMIYVIDRVYQMDGAILVVSAADGPMPQTRYTEKKSCICFAIYLYL